MLPKEFPDQPFSAVALDRSPHLTTGSDTQANRPFRAGAQIDDKMGGTELASGCPDALEIP